MLLTAYADTEAAISAINTVGLDHYLMKPWTPAEENLYPVLDDLISDWEATATLTLRRYPGGGHFMVGEFPQHQGFSGTQPDSLPVSRHRA